MLRREAGAVSIGQSMHDNERPLSLAIVMTLRRIFAVAVLAFSCGTALAVPPAAAALGPEREALEAQARAYVREHVEPLHLEGQRLDAAFDRLFAAGLACRANEAVGLVWLACVTPPSAAPAGCDAIGVALGVDPGGRPVQGTPEAKLARDLAQPVLSVAGYCDLPPSGARSDRTGFEDAPPAASTDALRVYGVSLASGADSLDALLRRALLADMTCRLHPADGAQRLDCEAGVAALRAVQECARGTLAWSAPSRGAGAARLVRAVCLEEGFLMAPAAAPPPGRHEPTHELDMFVLEFTCAMQDRKWRDTPILAALMKSEGLALSASQWDEQDGAPLARCVRQRQWVPAAVCEGIARLDVREAGSAREFMRAQHAQVDRLAPVIAWVGRAMGHEDVAASCPPATLVPSGAASAP